MASVSRRSSTPRRPRNQQQRDGAGGLRVYSKTDNMACQFCKKTLKDDKTQATFAFLFDVDVDVLLKSTRGERRKHLDVFLKMVNVLLNEGGGVIYIHAATQLLAFWDEQVDEDLMSLVADDSLFSQNYERHVLDDSHVAFRVKPAFRIKPGHHRPLSSRDFKSKVSLNKGLDDPTHGQMRFLVSNISPGDPLLWEDDDDHRLTFHPQSLRRGDKVPFHEDLCMQAKVVQENKIDRAQGRDRASKLLDYWWKDLKLPNYITAFSKQANGGSFFIGFREEKTERGTRWKYMENMKGLEAIFGTERRFWEDDKNDEERKVYHVAKREDVPAYEIRTGFYICEGVRLSARDREDLPQYLQRKLETHMAWHPRFPQEPPVTLHFYDVEENNNENGDTNDDTNGDMGHTFGGQRSSGLNSSSAGSKSQLMKNSARRSDVKTGTSAAVGSTDSKSSEMTRFTNTDASAAVGNGDRGSKEMKELCVVEARVRGFKGVCFQDKCGPEAYKFDHSMNPTKGVPIPMTDWIRAQS